MKRIIAVAVCVAALVGCVSYKGGDYVDGVVMSAGFKIPVGDGFQFTLLNLTSGNVFKFDQNGQMRIKCASTNEVSVIGVYSSKSFKYTEAEFNPTEATVADEEEKSTEDAPLKNQDENGIISTTTKEGEK